MMHEHWQGEWGGGWWWVPMLIMMLLFWGGLIWVGLTLVRSTGQGSGMDRPPLRAADPDGRTILEQRFARGEIDIDDYRARVDALRAAEPPKRRRR